MLFVAAAIGCYVVPDGGYDDVDYGKCEGTNVLLTTNRGGKTMRRPTFLTFASVHHQDQLFNWSLALRVGTYF